MEGVGKKIEMKVEWKVLEFRGVMGEVERGKVERIWNEVGVREEGKERYKFRKG